MLLLEYIVTTIGQEGVSIIEISDLKEKIDLIKNTSSQLDYQSLFKILDSISREDNLGISMEFLITSLSDHLSNLEMFDEFETIPMKNMVGSVPILSVLSNNLIKMNKLFSYQIDDFFEVILQQP
jgi:tyrosyl-tRNA synthetase